MDRQPMPAQGRWPALAALGCLNLLCIGFAGVGSARFLGWPLSFGVPLFGQALFFMAFCYALARRTPLYPDHPSFAHSPLTTIIARMERTRRRLLVVDLAGGGIAVSLGLSFLVAAGPHTPGERPLLLVMANVMLALGFALLAHSATLFPRRSAYEYARYAGTPARARLLKVTNTGIGRRLATYDSARLYHLDLEVMPPAGAAYPVTIRQLIRRHPSIMPAVGAVIPVKYLPEQPQVVVALLNPEDRPPDDRGILKG